MKPSLTISNIVTDFKKQANDGVSILYDAHDVVVCPDRDKISQVIHNLISNVLKFTKSGSIIVSTTEQNNNEDESIVVEIKDTGKGIDPEVVLSLFTKFMTKSDKGPGLGLYISKGIVEAHAGKIWAENNKEGGERETTLLQPPKGPESVGKRK
jgi:signal transduction histidine kinase